MSRSPSKTSIQYAAEIKHVREVGLYGTADLAFWSAILQPEGLVPYDSSGKAELAIIGTALRWKGFKFRELIVTVALCAGADQAQRDGFYLVHAFNSSPILAFAERFLFKTPYYRGNVHVAEAIPARIELRAKQRLLFNASMAQPQAPSAIQAETWSGPVFLPKQPARNQPGSKFFVSLSGEQQIYPFSPAGDQLEIRPAEDHNVFQWLIDSHFTATEWRIRADAEHAKSKTYPREFNADSRLANPRSR